MKKYTLPLAALAAGLCMTSASALVNPEYDNGARWRVSGIFCRNLMEVMKLYDHVKESFISYSPEAAANVIDESNTNCIYHSGNAIRGESRQIKDTDKSVVLFCFDTLVEHPTKWWYTVETNQSI